MCLLYIINREYCRLVPLWRNIPRNFFSLDNNREKNSLEKYRCSRTYVIFPPKSAEDLLYCSKFFILHFKHGLEQKQFKICNGRKAKLQMSLRNQYRVLFVKVLTCFTLLTPKGDILEQSCRQLVKVWSFLLLLEENRWPVLFFVLPKLQIHVPFAKALTFSS